MTDYEYVPCPQCGYGYGDGFGDGFGDGDGSGYGAWHFVPSIEVPEGNPVLEVHD